jgi:hypothetical protein
LKSTSWRDSQHGFDGSTEQRPDFVYGSRGERFHADDGAQDKEASHLRAEELGLEPSVLSNHHAGCFLHQPPLDQLSQSRHVGGVADDGAEQRRNTLLVLVEHALEKRADDALAESGRSITKQIREPLPERREIHGAAEEFVFGTKKVANECKIDARTRRHGAERGSSEPALREELACGAQDLFP